MNCCLDCKNRTPTCHGECELYSKWCEEQSKIKEKKKKILRKHWDYFYKNPKQNKKSY